MKKYLNATDYIFFFSIIIFIVLGFYYRIIALFGLFIGIFYIIINKNDKLFCLLLFLMPFAQIFKLTANSTSLFTVLEFLTLLKLFTMSGIKKNYILIVGLYILFIFSTSLIADNIGFLSIIKLFMGLSLIYYFINSYDEKWIGSITYSYIFGLIFSSIVGLFKFKIPGLANMYNDLNLQYINRIEVTRFSGTFADPNYYSIAVLVGLGLIICYLYKSNDKNILIKLLSLLLIIFGLNTYSKSFALMLVLILFVAYKILINNKKIITKGIIIVAISIIILSGVINKVPMIKLILYRFTSSNGIDTLTTGRSIIWSNYINYIINSIRVFLIGEGIGAPYLIGATHNMYIEMWYYIGLIGIFYTIIVVKFLFQQRILTKKHIINYFMLIIILISFFFLAGYTAFEIPFYLMISWVILNTNFYSKRM